MNCKKSLNSNTAYVLTVVNNTSNPVQAIWLDYQGKEVDKGTIAAGGGTWGQDTYATHPWIFRDTSSGDDVLGLIGESSTNLSLAIG